MPKYTRSTRDIARTRRLRKGDNLAEALLWSRLKASNLEGHKFVRQHPIGPFIADFACRSQRLIIEVDGSQRLDSTDGVQRDHFLRRQGYSVLRF